MQSTESTTDTSTTNTTEVEDTSKKRRRSNSFASLLKNAANMASGISEHTEVLSARKLNEELVTRINTVIDNCRDLDNEQEILKGQLKEKTSRLDESVKELKDILHESTFIVKAVIPQKRWVDFGMSAKK